MKGGEDKRKDLSLLFDELDALPETDEERRAELVALGIDIDAASTRFGQAIRRHEREAARRDLEVADRERREHGLKDRANEVVRQMRLSTEELIGRLREGGPAFAHRELDSWSHTDLESAYADKLALEGLDSEEAD